MRNAMAMESTIVLVRDTNSGDTEMWLVEVKSCYLNISDVNDAVGQFQTTERVLQSQGVLRTCRQVVRVLLHDNTRGRGCGVYDKAMDLIQRECIRYLSVSGGGPLARFLLNCYKELYKKN